MKKAKKIVALLLCAVLLIGASVAGTVAYLTSQDTVVNTFTVGKVQIELDEADVNEYGERLYKQGTDETGNLILTTDSANGAELADRVHENAYKLIPGRTYVKDPLVTVKGGSEDCYVYVVVRVDYNKNAETMMVNKENYQNAVSDPTQNLITDTDDVWLYTEYFDKDNWLAIDGWEMFTGKHKETGSADLFYFRYKNVKAEEGSDPYIFEGSNEDVTLPKLFTSFKIPEEITNEQIKTLEGFKISVFAAAIQADGFTSDSDGETKAVEVAFEEINLPDEFKI